MEQTFTEKDFKDASPCVSPRPRLRSCSVRKTDCLSTEEWDEMRPRTRSFPSRSEYKKPQLLSPTVSNEGDLYRVRSFETTSKGIVNLGDCMKSRSLNSIVSSCSSNTDISQESTDPGPVSPDCPVFRVSVLGSVGVGKTALLQQFMTSEYLGGFDTSLDSEAERSISISLDGEENSLSFTEIDLPDYSSLPIGAAQSYMVVYSIAKRITFDQATSTVRHLRKTAARSAPILVVGNKTDIVRRRIVTTEDGKSLAKKYSCKFIETSTILNYHVDELLVGILSQLRLKCSKSDETAKKSSCYKTATARLMDKLKAFHSDALKRKSCENLFAL